MAWVVKLEEVIDGKVVTRSKVTTLDRPAHLESLDDLGLRLRLRRMPRHCWHASKPRLSRARFNATLKDGPCVLIAGSGDA